MLTALILPLIIATRTVAVVDLSSPKQPSMADALRRTPAFRSVALPTARTNAMVADAESLGLICTVDDSACLEKLLVLTRADELLAFSATAAGIEVTQLGRNLAKRALVKANPSPTAAALAIVNALRADSPSTVPTGTGSTSGRRPPRGRRRPRPRRRPRRPPRPRPSRRQRPPRRGPRRHPRRRRPRAQLRQPRRSRRRRRDPSWDPRPPQGRRAPPPTACPQGSPSPSPAALWPWGAAPVPSG